MTGEDAVGVSHSVLINRYVIIIIIIIQYTMLNETECIGSSVYQHDHL